MLSDSKIVQNGPLLRQIDQLRVCVCVWKTNGDGIHVTIIDNVPSNGYDYDMALFREAHIIHPPDDDLNWSL